MTVDEAIREAKELNENGAHRKEWFYYPAYHEHKNEWFVMRGRKFAELRVATFLTGKRSALENGSNDT
ncbi:hypothetical protein HMSP1_91 [Sinorhizobium phage HMSP1-Susan]|nr:hypothetical protein HMSP1_91 [Sinorhizobium phage HMSP1-Susan]